MTPAKGALRIFGTSEWRQINICFDQEQFDEIKERAVKEKTSFADQVRLLVEWGLEAN